MVIAVAAFGLALHPDRGEVGTGIGSAAPTPRRAQAGRDSSSARRWTADGLWESRGDLPEALVREFGVQVAAAADRSTTSGVLRRTACTRSP